MATYTANDIIGKKLFATRKVTAHYGNAWSTDTFIINKGLPVGKVFSYVYKSTPNNDVYWHFYDSNNKAYFVRADKTRLRLDIVEEADMRSQEQIAAAKKEEQKKKDKGVVPYYLEKYGKPIIVIASLLTAYKIFTDAKKN